jgi:hypothetical protein
MKRIITKKEIEKLDKAIRRDTGTEADAENIERMLYNYMLRLRTVLYQRRNKPLNIGEKAHYRAIQKQIAVG